MISSLEKENVQMYIFLNAPCTPCLLPCSMYYGETQATAKRPATVESNLLSLNPLCPLGPRLQRMQGSRVT